MARPASTERVRRRRDKMRAASMRPVQSWVTDTSAPGFAAECRRQCVLLAQAGKSPEAPAETAFWESATADAWADLG